MPNISSYSSQCNTRCWGTFSPKQVRNLHISNASRHGENVEVPASYTILHMLNLSTKPHTLLYERSHASICVRAHHIINHPNHCLNWNLDHTCFNVRHNLWHMWRDSSSMHMFSYFDILHYCWSYLTMHFTHLWRNPILALISLTHTMYTLNCNINL